MKRSLFNLLALTAMLAMMFAFTGCSDDDDDGGTGPGTQPDQFEVVRTAIDNWLTVGPTPITTSIALNDLMNDADTANDPFVLSVRAEDVYNMGHVPGAARIGWHDVAQTANLATLPTNQDIVVYCYTGHTGQVATTALGVLGYDVKNMKFGMLSWSKDADIRGGQSYTLPNPGAAIEMTANVPTTTYAAPTMDVTTSTSEAEILRAAVDAYIATAAPVTTASAVAANLGDYTIVSVRSAAAYAAGHIPGAINIPWKEIAKTENLEKLPPDQPILVYCYTGHTGQIATAALGMLGYDVKNLKFGMSGWSDDDTYMDGVARFDEADWPNLSTEGTMVP